MNAESDIPHARPMRAWAMTIIGASLLLRHDELTTINMSIIEFNAAGLSRINIYIYIFARRQQKQARKDMLFVG